MIMKGIAMFFGGFFVSLIISAVLREHTFAVFIASYTIGFLICLIYGTTTSSH